MYEYNMMVIERYQARSREKVAPGKHRIEAVTTIAKPGAPADVVLSVDGREVARTTVKRTVPAAFSASETFGVGVDLGSPVSLDYFDRRPFRFDGKIGSLRRFKEDVREVQSGYECGISLESFHDIKPGDVFEVYQIETIKAEL